MARRPRYLVVVRRGETETFQGLQEHFASGPDPTPVVWDRRVRDRRVIIQDVEGERRRGDRRAPIDATMWTKRGFVVVRVDKPSAEDAELAGDRRHAASGPAGRRPPRRPRGGRRGLTR